MRDFNGWVSSLERRREDRREVISLPHTVHVSLKASQPLTLVFWADIHTGGDEVNYKRIKTTVQYIKQNHCKVLLLGDLINGYFWAPAVYDDLANVQEQALFMDAMLKELRGNLIGAVFGDHDESWVGKAGGLSIYHQFKEKYGAPAVSGVGYFYIKVNGIMYKIVATHRHKGQGKGAKSAINLGTLAEGFDIAVTAHNHEKNSLTSTITEFGGTSREVFYFALGPEKASDSYSRKLGYPHLSEAQMGASAAILDNKSRNISPLWSIPKLSHP